jgi:hypothetical protein
MEEQENQNQTQQFLADPNLTDQQRIQLNIDEFYQSMKSVTQDPEKIIQIKLMRNNIINMVDSYLKKFDNKEIMTEFYNRLKQAYNIATKNNVVNKYVQYMNEIRLIQEYLGMSENIAEKLAEQLFDQWKKWEEDNRVRKDDDN